MTDVYNKQIRCVLELAVAVWMPGLTMAESDQIERVHKCALHVILGDNYLSYSQALSNLGTDKLSDRRSKLCLNFVKRQKTLYLHILIPEVIRLLNKQNTDQFPVEQIDIASPPSHF